MGLSGNIIIPNSWKKGLKTGIYYLRTQSKSLAQKFSVDLVEKVKENTVDKKEDTTKKETNVMVNVKEEPECLMCSS